MTPPTPEQVEAVQLAAVLKDRDAILRELRIVATRLGIASRRPTAEELVAQIDHIEEGAAEMAARLAVPRG